MLYKEHEVVISGNQKKKLQTALKNNKPTLSVTLQHYGGETATLLLTKQQITHVEKARAKNKNITIKMSKQQLHANVTFKGGFLGMLAGLAARALPSLLTGLASGLISGAVEKAVKGGDGLYIQKGKHCYRADPVEGDGLFLSPRTRLHTVGDGLFLKHGHNVYGGEGLIFGEDSPFKDIPILGWFL